MNKNPKDEAGNTPLHHSSEQDHFDICKLIISCIEDKNPVNEFGETPLHIAAEFGHVEIYKLN